MNQDFVRQRITQLRLHKGVSEYQMSYDLGHSRGYVNNISCGKALPSMNEFLVICAYFGITPSEFFNEKTADPVAVHEITANLCGLDKDDLHLIAALARRLAGKRKRRCAEKNI